MSIGDHLKAFFLGMNEIEYREYEITRLKKDTEKLIDYKPNIITFFRDSAGFGRIDIGAIYYGIQLIAIAAIVLMTWGHYTSIKEYLPLSIFPILSMIVGLILNIKYPVSDDYRYSFGIKKRKKL